MVKHYYGAPCQHSWETHTHTCTAPGQTPFTFKIGMGGVSDTSHPWIVFASFCVLLVIYLTYGFAFIFCFLFSVYLFNSCSHLTSHFLMDTPPAFPPSLRVSSS